MKLSIVIPVYNVERYIKRCLSSCVNQTLPKDCYEIIIVNDGTEDDSMLVVNQFAKEYSNIIVLSQTNQGLSVARNNGLKCASGEYIWFVDSDDWIEENCLEDICSQLVDHIDLLQLQYCKVYDNRMEFISHCKIFPILTGKEQILRGGIPIPAQFTIYRKQFLIDNQLFFYPGIYHEDSEFKPRALYFANSIKSLDRIVYNYYQRQEGSIMSDFKLKNGLDLLFVNNRIISFIESQKMTIKYRIVFYNIIGLNINTLLFGTRKLNGVDRMDLLYQLRKNKHQLCKMFLSCNIKYMLESLFFIININLGLFIYKTLR